jgi:leucyl/phenylalanyl-tRNA--protein transferase
VSDGDLTPDLLLGAYSAGIFPMAEKRESPEVFWVDPVRRGIIPLDGFRMSRSLRRTMLRRPHAVTFDADFTAVVEACAQREETWINETIRRLYVALHLRGHAHSVEVWQDGALTGGAYGVSIGGAFFGESMFSRARDGSKIALAYLVDRLREAGFELLDTQFVTDHLRSLGAIEISRAEYRIRLAQALEIETGFAAAGAPPAPLELLARMQRATDGGGTPER